MSFSEAGKLQERGFKTYSTGDRPLVLGQVDPSSVEKGLHLTISAPSSKLDLELLVKSEQLEAVGQELLEFSDAIMVLRKTKVDKVLRSAPFLMRSSV
ncbi:hypothetical protein VNO77_02695 [Canavalia gladiata]|uniref:Uncharacterized protein n=1 Tax=Canavalia gladiata TaxID=3824 RepID=A0AAN9MVI2_CANGL